MFTYDREVVETCPHCCFENIYEAGTEFPSQFVGVCKNCGRQIFLCDECMHNEDNTEMHCDWCLKDGCDKCFRGEIGDDKSYTVVYKETLIHTFTIDAKNEEQARKVFEKMSANGELDFSDGEIDDTEIVSIKEI